MRPVIKNTVRVNMLSILTPRSKQKTHRLNLFHNLAAGIATLDLRNVTLVGHSTGGGEVVRYIGRHGTKRVVKAVLIAAVPPGRTRASFVCTCVCVPITAVTRPSSQRGSATFSLVASA